MGKMLSRHIKHDFSSYESSDHYERFNEEEMKEAMRNHYGVAL